MQSIDSGDFKITTHLTQFRSCKSWVLFACPFLNFVLERNPAYEAAGCA